MTNSNFTAMEQPGKHLIHNVSSEDEDASHHQHQTNPKLSHSTPIPVTSFTPFPHSNSSIDLSKHQTISKSPGSTTDTAVSSPASIKGKGASVQPYGANYGKKYVHWTDSQVERLSSYLRDHVTFATSPCVEACELIKLKVFPDEDEVTPKRLFGKICNMRAAYRRSGAAAVEKDASEEPNGRKRRKRRHFQMDNIYSQYDPLSKDESKKNKRKLNSFDYDDYEDDDEDDRSSNGTDNKEKDPYATPKPDESMPPSNQLLSGMPSVAASVTNSNSGSRAPSEGASDSQFDDEQRMLDEELLQLTTKKRGRPPGRKSKPTTAASSIANSPEQVAPRKPGRPRKKHMIEDLIKAETELRGQNGARVHTGLATINSSYSQPVALAPSAGSNRIASTGTSISPTSSIASGASVASCITSPSSPSTLPPTSHPVQAISGNTHDSIPKHNTAFSLAEFKDIDINGLDMESIENEIAAITKQHYQHVDHYPELQHILSSEFDIDQNLPVPPSLSNKFKLPKLNNDSIPTTNDTSNPIKINDITGNNISKELNAISESAGNLAELTESLQLVNGLNQAMVQQLRAWQSVAHSFEQSDATIDQATNTGTKTTNTENNDANPPMLLNFLSQKLKFDFLTTRSLVHATSHLLFPTENNGADHSLSNCDLHSRATLLYSYTQLLQSRDTTNYLRTLYTSRLSETARLRYLESRNRVLEARLKAQEASQKAVDTQMKREEARMRAEEAKMRAVEAKMKAREWKCRTKVEVRNEKERMKIADDHDDCDHNTDHCHVESGCERIEVDPKALADSKPDSNGIKAEDSESFNRTADPVASPESERLSNNEHVIV